MTFRDSKFAVADKPYTTDELAALLAEFPPGTRVYVGGAGFAFKPNSVHFGNYYSPDDHSFMTIEGVDRRFR